MTHHSVVATHEPSSSNYFKKRPPTLIHVSGLRQFAHDYVNCVVGGVRMTFGRMQVEDNRQTWHRPGPSWGEGLPTRGRWVNNSPAPRCPSTASWWVFPPPPQSWTRTQPLQWPWSWNADTHRSHHSPVDLVVHAVPLVRELQQQTRLPNSFVTSDDELEEIRVRIVRRIESRSVAPTWTTRTWRGAWTRWCALKTRLTHTQRQRDRVDKNGSPEENKGLVKNKKKSDERDEGGTEDTREKACFNQHPTDRQELRLSQRLKYSANIFTRVLVPHCERFSKFSCRSLGSVARLLSCLLGLDHIVAGCVRVCRGEREGEAEVESGRDLGKGAVGATRKCFVVVGWLWVFLLCYKEAW